MPPPAQWVQHFPFRSARRFACITLSGLLCETCEDVIGTIASGGAVEGADEHPRIPHISSNMESNRFV